MPLIFIRLAALSAALAAAPLIALPAAAQSGASSSGGVSITIRKGPTYLNTRTVARPRASDADYRTSALYQSVINTRTAGLERYPLPSSFSLPGY